MKRAPGPWWLKLAWLVAIWAVSVAGLAAVSVILRAWLAP